MIDSVDFLRATLNSQLFAPFGSSSFDYLFAIRSAHPFPKAVFFGPFPFFWLVSAFAHDVRVQEKRSRFKSAKAENIRLGSIKARPCA